MDSGIFHNILIFLIVVITIAALYQITGLIRGCFLRKKEIARFISWFAAVRKNESSLQCSTVFISNSLYSKNNRTFRKYLQMNIFVETSHAVETARSLGMEVSDNSKPNNPSYCCSFVLRKHMTGLERMLLLYRLYDRIEENYQQDKVEFHPLQKCINIFFQRS